jgi:peptidoglycan/LPS O-acetylase OafA/YrhL
MAGIAVPPPEREIYPGEVSRRMTQAVRKTAGATAQRAERFYLPELDVLRFFAVFGVFLYHVLPGTVTAYHSEVWPGSLLNAGAFGVDLFFTLSGYLITSLLLKERDETGGINLKAFYARRTLRIWPLYYFSIGLAFLLTQLPTSMTSAPPFLGNVFGPIKANAYLFMALFVFNFNFDGCLMAEPMPITALLWSISVEEQFYAFWPWFARYFPRKRIVIIPVLMIAVGVIVRASLTFDLKRLVWNYTFVHFDSIAIGILIALLPALYPGTALRLLLALAGVASWAFAASWCKIPDSDNTLLISLGYPAIALGSGAFVLAALGARSLRASNAPLRFMIYLGKVSYGIYVYDIIAISAVKLLLFRGIIRNLLGVGWMPRTESVLYVVFAFGLNVAMATASYRFLESPFLRLKERFARVPSRAV